MISLAEWTFYILHEKPKKTKIILTTYIFSSPGSYAYDLKLNPDQQRNSYSKHSPKQLKSIIYPLQNLY